MNAKTDKGQDQAYRLGLEAGLLLMEQPKDWKVKIRANIRKARKLGVKIEPGSFFDIMEPTKPK